MHAQPEHQIWVLTALHTGKRLRSSTLKVQTSGFERSKAKAQSFAKPANHLTGAEMHRGRKFTGGISGRRLLFEGHISSFSTSSSQPGAK